MRKTNSLENEMLFAFFIVPFDNTVKELLYTSPAKKPLSTS